MTANSRRFEIDALRGLAVIGMIAYHFIYDLWAFGGVDIDPFSSDWRLFARVILCAFLVISGISDALVSARGMTASERWQRAGRRALRLAGAALLVTVATRLVLGDEYVRFGVLHLLTGAALVTPLFDRWPTTGIIAAGLSTIVLGIWMNGLSAAGINGDLLLLPLGLPPAGFVSVDYVPLLPWFGVVLFGLALGRFLCRRPLARGAAVVQPLTWIGRHTLVIYLVHQPILLGIFWAFGALQK